ncbi:MAG: hypothetical protein ACYC6J_02450 [Coriobacteriia bacterium]
MSKPSPAGLAPRLSRAHRALSVTLAAASFLFGALSATPASAAIAPSFDARLVIADDVFRASGSMSAQDIQAFLERYPGVLDVTLAARRADGTMQPVSLLIWEVAQEFNINPKVLLVTLQKEQSLLTRTAPSQTTLDWALGFGCYDGSTPETRDPKFKGLGNQIWYAARALDMYAETTWKPGLKRTICINCVTTPYTPDIEFVAENLSTFKLYVYTPHSHGPTPDIHGGNYLFWTLYWRYFDEGPLASAALKPVYRFYNKSNGTHFYTASEAERYTVTKKWPATFAFEGVAYRVNTANAANSVPLHRFYNKKTASHFYTVSTDERDMVLAKWPATFTYEGAAYNVSSSADNAAPMYRFYNRRTGSHFYTESDAERDTVIARLSGTYTYEGVAYHVGR